MTELPDWPRTYFEPGGGDASIWYVIYGPRPSGPEIFYVEILWPE